MVSELDNVSTAELVRALFTREGVKVEIAKPYEDLEIMVNGPALVLTIID